MIIQSMPAESHGRTINYGFKREVKTPFNETLERVRAALADEGFGVLCEINLKEKFREKLGVDFGNYVILGACAPTLAFEALQEEMDLGLLLPCNVVVYQNGEKTTVSAIDAVRMMSVVGNEELNKTAQTVNEKLWRAIQAV